MTNKHIHISTNDMISQPTVDQISYTQQSMVIDTEATVLWTPAFILFFAILFGLGMSIASLLSYIWVNSQLYPIDNMGEAYSVVLVVMWLTIIVRARSGGTRLGAVFGCIWALGILGQFWLNNHAIEPQAAIMTEMRALSNSALLGSALCLSTSRVRLQRWDKAFLWLLPFLFCSYLAYSYIKAPTDMHSLLFIEGKIASITIYLAIGVWWLRIGCWRDQAGPTFLLGLAIILWWLSDKIGNINTELSLYILQMFFIYLIMGIVRILQGERRLTKRTSKPHTNML